MKPESSNIQHITTEVRRLIAQSRQNVALAVNASMSLLYWQIGQRINQEVLQVKRAEYGKYVISSISKQLMAEFGGSFSEKNLRRMVQFATVFPDEQIVVSLIRQLSWTHILALIPITDPLKRAFYIQICIHENWSVRTFRERINSMLYERTAISKKPEQTITNDLDLLRSEHQLSPDLVFRDPYVLDFLGLSETYSEKDLEASIIVELQRFIVEMGTDFAYCIFCSILTPFW
ncbi:putative nuclease of restriction endonuclease-like (RecB) superfamily [Dyadobacter jejuensis]|uniref:Putative nuclease of restriction endonuclease-like (RecB) superfamily n=2 Tax=Dyadobacter jejuensis TaxID=1082580 RepID=A0A316AHD9_9BACT|nr:putative nuclease of restriction endonuclease-like (RecB) superfamily [Dyadobacter jejuensis]